MSSPEYHLVYSSVVHYYPHLTDERTETERIKYHGTLYHLASTLHAFCYLCHLPPRLHYTLSIPLGVAVWLVWASGMLADVLQIDGWQCPPEGHISGSLLVPGSVSVMQPMDTMTYPRSQSWKQYNQYRHTSPKSKFHVFLLQIVRKASHAEFDGNDDHSSIFQTSGSISEFQDTH